MVVPCSLIIIPGDSRNTKNRWWASLSTQSFIKLTHIVTKQLRTEILERFWWQAAPSPDYALSVRSNRMLGVTLKMKANISFALYIKLKPVIRNMVWSQQCSAPLCSLLMTWGRNLYDGLQRCGWRATLGSRSAEHIHNCKVRYGCSSRW